MAHRPVKLLGSRGLLNRLLDEPELVAVVRSLDPKVLSHLIEHVGLEDSGEIVSLATTEQLEKVFDHDLWRNSRPGAEERFDIERFGTWVEVLLEAGATFAADRLLSLDSDFLVMALSQHLHVLDVDEIAQDRMGRDHDDDEAIADKILESGLSHEFQEYLVVSRNERSWDAMFSILIAIDENHGDEFVKIMDRCKRATAGKVDDHGGLLQLLSAEEELHDDVAGARDEKREREGFVTPAMAANFLGQARRTPLAALISETSLDPVSSSYFRNFEIRLKSASTAPPKSSAHETQEAKSMAALMPARPSADIATKVRDFTRLLQAEGVLEAPHAFLGATGSQADTSKEDSPLMRQMLARLRDTDNEAFEKATRELAYLANIIIAGCPLQDRRMRPTEAAEAAMACCNLGFETLTSGEDHGVIKAFRVGLKVLFDEVTCKCASLIADSVSTLQVHEPGKESNRDAWLKNELSRLSMHLRKCLDENRPWMMRNRLDLLASVLPLSEVQIMKALIDELPVLISGERPMEFISSRSQIGRIGRYAVTFWNDARHSRK